MGEVNGAAIAALYESAIAGELWLDDGVGQECAAHCQELIDELEIQAEAMSLFFRNGAFGGFVSAQQLAAGFARKAEQAREELIRCRAVVERMRETFLAADRSYAAASEAHAQLLREAGGDAR